MKKCLWALLLLCVGATAFADLAPAEVKADYGGALRLRQEYWENTTDLQAVPSPTHADRDYFRLRSQLWGKVDLSQDFGFYLRIGNEMKYYIGNYKPQLDIPGNQQNFDIDELYIDNLYVDAKNIFGLPIDFRIGRQDLLGQYGENFLIMDGTPADGSRTFYFNAAKATVKFDKNNSLDLVYLYNTKTDQYLPSLYPGRLDSSAYEGNKRILNASNEEGAIVYFKSKINDNVALEPYYIYKREASISAAVPELKLNTVGGRAVLTAGTWKARAEYAQQFGDYANISIDRKGKGGYIFLGQKLEQISLKPEWEIGYVYLSGDDPTTATKEEFNPLFSRGPLWNELYIYTIISETAAYGGPYPGYWTNLNLYRAGLKLTLSAATNISVSYQFLRSDEKTATTGMLSGTSKDRGQLGTLMLSHAFTKQIDGYLQAEYFVPGGFYIDTAQNAAFLRWQLQYRF